MDRNEYRTSEGSCIISEDVIASIASSAALEVPGVAGMAQRPADIRGIIGNAAAKAVRVLNNESETILDVYINIKLGARIPDVAPAVQHGVKVAVQSMTGKPVNKVNVHIAGIVLKRTKRLLLIWAEPPRVVEGFFIAKQQGPGTRTQSSIAVECGVFIMVDVVFWVIL